MNLKIRQLNDKGQTRNKFLITECLLHKPNVSGAISLSVLKAHYLVNYCIAFIHTIHGYDNCTVLFLLRN